MLATRPTNPTAPQWQAAWHDAVDEALDIFCTHDPHLWVVTDGADAGLAHLVTDHRDLPGTTDFVCDGPPLARRRVCPHVAVAAAAVGLLDPDPPRGA